jgi:hypothetical protein
MLRPRLTAFHDPLQRFLLISLFSIAGCGSTNGAKCPEDSATPPQCPACPDGPRPAGAPLVIPAETLTTDRERRLSLVAFSENGGTALLRVEDDAVGDFFETVDLAVEPVPRVLKTWMFQSLTEPLALRQALRALKPQAAGPASQKNRAGVTLVGADDGERVVILAMKGERAVPIATLSRLRDADGVLADVSIVKLAWDPTGVRALVIHGQRLAAAPGFESQWLHVLKVDPSALPF